MSEHASEQVSSASPGARSPAPVALDFIARLAARAGGTASTARPRVRSRFEDVRGGDPAVVDTEHVAAPPPPRTATPGRPADPPNVHVPEQSVPAPQPRDSPRAADDRAAPVEPPVRVLAVRESWRPPPVHAEPGAVEHAARVIEMHSDRTVVVRAVPVVPVAARLPAPGADHGDATPAADNEPSVRITIGRVEVRAAAPAPPAVPAPRRLAPKSDSLPLHDYLRGRRGSS